MTQWYVLQVLSGHEAKVKRQIDEARARLGMTEQIEEVMLPTENVSEVKNGQRKIVEKKIWPGYLLVRMAYSDEAWSCVKDAPGVIDFLGGSSPTSLTQAEVDEILADLSQKKEGVVHKHQFEAGDKVKINDGVFVNFMGTVLEVHSDKGRLSVMVSIFGRDTRVDDLEFWQVEKVTEE
jgi:transcriptional antiterminator NusG